MLSVIIIAKNEEANLERCLQSIQWADEIIVLDSGSLDDTVAIAKKYTSKVYETDWQGYGVQKQRALSHATGDWVLNLDADEFVDAILRQAIELQLQAPKVDAYRIPIRMVFYNQPLHFSSSPKRHVRLFKRIGACYSDDLVHEKIILPSGSRVGRLKQAIMHHSFRDISHALHKINRYSSYSARIRQQNNTSTSLVKALLGASWMFFRCYFLQRGILDGKAGFLLAVFNAQGTFYRNVKQLYPDSPHSNLPPIIKDNYGTTD